MGTVDTIFILHRVIYTSIEH